MGFRHSKWTKASGSGGTRGSDGSGASGSKSYHNGGVEGASFSKWYDEFLAKDFGGEDGKGSGSGGTKGSGSGGTKGSGSGGTKGSGSGGTKGSGSGGTKGSGSGGTKGSGSGGTKGSGSGGTKGSGSGGTKGSGSGGTKGSGSGGTKGSGSGGTKGSGSGGTKGSGSGGTKGSGSGGTKGSGSGGTKGSGSGGTKGSGSGGTKGSGSGGTKGSGSGGTQGGGDPDPDPVKSTLNFTMGNLAELHISVTEDVGGQLFFNITQADFLEEPVDIDGIFFSLADDSELGSLNFFPDENTREVTDIQASADGVTALPNGAQAGGTFDVGLQFGLTPDSAAGNVTATNFTLWSDDGPVTLDDIDLSGMRVVINSEGPNGESLGVSASDDPDFMEGDAEPDSDATLLDVMALMTVPVEEEDVPEDAPEEADELVI